jgi:cell division protein FtsQ
MRRLIDALLRRRPKKAKRFKAGWAVFLPPVWRKRVGYGGLALIALAASGFGAHRALKSEAVAELRASVDDIVQGLAVDSGFVVRSVAIEGLSEARRDDVLAALAIEIGEPILGVEPAAARARLERVGWIKSASVGRRLDGAIDVRIEERKPFALWQKDGRLLLVDREGTPITDQRLGRFAHLPLVVGEDAARHAARLLDALAQESVLYPQIAAAIRIGGRRWTLRLASGVEILLPEEDPEGAWERLARLEREHNLLGRAISAIDLRLSDRMILRLAPGTLHRAREGGQQT